MNKLERRILTICTFALWVLFGVLLYSGRNGVEGMFTKKLNPQALSNAVFMAKVCGLFYGSIVLGATGITIRSYLQISIKRRRLA